MTTGKDIKREDWCSLVGMTPGPVLRAFGMRRSGNHAIIHWLCRNAPNGQSLFLNNCKGRRHPAENYSSVERNLRRLSPARKGGLDVIGKKAGDGALLVFSFENMLPNATRTGSSFSKGVREEGIDCDVIIYRSFLNWLASYLKKHTGGEYWNRLTRMARVGAACQQYFDCLNLVETGGGPRALMVHYDRWLEDAGYRVDLLDQLGWEMRDDALGEITWQGGGSSFGAQEVDANALSQRWQKMKDDPEYRALLWMVASVPAYMERLEKLFPEDHAVIPSLLKSFDLEKE